jgi:predicted AAA+ superfamily ATPase
MYKREMYLRRIRPFYKNEQIKVLSGVRRAGKTEILKMIQEEVRTSSDDAHIVYMSFELLENKVYRASENLYSFIESKIVDNGFYYIFLDEVQFIEDWPEVVNSIKTKHRNVSIFLTGSNSKLLEDDKESILGGRTISFRIMPFTFAEFHEFRVQQGASQDPEREFTEYMKWGGFPLIFAEQNDSQKQIMLESIFDSIVLRDIVRRKKLKSSLELEHLIDYLIASSSSYISGRNVCDRLTRSGTSLSLPKILEFIKAADESCIVDIVSRYDVVGLQTVEFNNKSYTCDPAFINYKKSLVSDLYGVLFETIVYNDLIARGYTVRTGFAHGKEIDFIATKGNGERVYIQVAYEITDKNREREFGNFSSIKDNYPKYVISRDQVQLSENGIIHMNIVDFLLHPLEK